MMRLIDADTLKELICSNVYPIADAFNSRDYGMFWTGGIEKAIDEMPTIAQQRMKGKWIIRETENDRYDDMICPFCKTCYTVDAYRIDDIGFTAEDFNFCPNCGADMRGEEDDCK